MKWYDMKGISLEAQYLYRKALEHADQERYETALRYLTQVVVIAPLYAKAFCEMANCKAHLGYVEDAIRLYNRAIDIDPAYEEARVRRDMALITRERKGNPHQGMGTSW